VPGAAYEADAPVGVEVGPVRLEPDDGVARGLIQRRALSDAEDHPLVVEREPHRQDEGQGGGVDSDAPDAAGRQHREAPGSIEHLEAGTVGHRLDRFCRHRHLSSRP
jgi:hypothetical protein